MSTSTRRTTLSSRRRSSGSQRLLGAVKLQSPLGATDDASSPCSSCSASTMTTPLERSPLVVGRPPAVPASEPAAGGATAVAAADTLAQFSQQLASSRSADRWLEESLAPNSATQALPRRQQSAPQATLSPYSQHVESAASQIVHKALRFITADGTPPPPALPASARKAAFDSQSFLDKGMDAISGVGKLMEGFAITLDTVIGQAFEDWGSPSGAAAGTDKGGGRRPLSAAAAAAAPGSSAVPAAAWPAPKPAPAEQRGTWQDFSTDAKENLAVPAAARQSGKAAGSRQPHITSFMSKLDAASEQEVQEWRKRAQQLASELQRMRAQQEEFQRLRLQYDKLQQDLQQTSTQASKLAEENSHLKSRSLPSGADPAPEDPLAAQQVAKQMEALLLEKSKLVQENDRLLRENTGLQELLEFSLVHQAQLAGDDELFGSYDDDEGDAVEGVAAGQLLAASDNAAAVGSQVPLRVSG